MLGHAGLKFLHHTLTFSPILVLRYAFLKIYLRIRNIRCNRELDLSGQLFNLNLFSLKFELKVESKTKLHKLTFM